MTTLSKTFSLHPAKAHRNGTRSVWHDMGVGLAIALTAMTMIVVGTIGDHGPQAPGVSSVVERPKTFAGWENSSPRELFPLGPVTTDAPM